MDWKESARQGQSICVSTCLSSTETCALRSELISGIDDIICGGEWT
jgi:hypothetical protein